MAIALTGISGRIADPLPDSPTLRYVFYGLEFGAIWYYRWAITFTGDSNSEESLRFMMKVGRSPYQQFISLVTAKNPGFEVKNWTLF